MCLAWNGCGRRWQRVAGALRRVGWGLVVVCIVGGVAAVLGFVPQMLVLFLMLSILEDVGYMARVAFIMDVVSSAKFGLSGKSFIPMPDRFWLRACALSGQPQSSLKRTRPAHDHYDHLLCASAAPKMPIIGLVLPAPCGRQRPGGKQAYFIGVVYILSSAASC